MAMTDKDVDKLAGNRYLQNAETVEWREGMKPIKGGLFDTALTGGHGSEGWSAIKLTEPMPSPVFEEPIRRILGLTQKQYEDVISGKQAISHQHKLYEPKSEDLDIFGYGSGPEAIYKALRDLNVDKEIGIAEQQIKSGRKTLRDVAVRKLGYLKDAKKLKIHPSDWVLHKVPVLPPAFRPVSILSGSQAQMIADANYLYKELWDANQNLEQIKGIIDDVSEERLNLYNSFKAVTGLGDPTTPKNKERKVRGLIGHIIGHSPKTSSIQSSLLGSAVDLVGRAVIAPDQDLTMDEIGLPEDSAWNIYRPFIIRRLVRNGMPRLQAVKAVQDRVAGARTAMVDEMKERPVLANRAPTLHKYGFMAFWPQLTKGAALRISPIVYKGYGADNNGDSCLTPLTPIRINDILTCSSFEEFISKYLLEGYQERKAIEMFGKQTTILELRKDAKVEVPSADVNGKVGWSKVNAVSIHTSHGPDCYRVVTDCGLDTTFTAHHNFLVLDDNCELVATKTTAVNESYLLPYIFGIETEISGTICPEKPDLPLNFETGLWLGHYLADGATTGRDDVVSHASNDLALLELLEEIGKNFSPNRAWYEGNRKSIRWTGKPLVRMLNSCCGHGCAGKYFAGWMISASKEFRKGLVVGYLLGEGNMERGCARVECVNRKLLLGFQLILNSLGVSSRIKHGKDAGEHNMETWIIRLNRAQLTNLKLPWPKCQKSEQFDVPHSSEKTRQTWDVVPFPKVISDLCFARGKSLRGNSFATKELREVLNRTIRMKNHKDVMKAAKLGYCTRPLALFVIAALGLDKLMPQVMHNWIQLINNKNLCWTHIEKIEKVDRPDVTYDLSVEGTENFTIDGVYLTHNTMQFHVPASEDAKEEAIEKMLPSKNLFSASSFKAHYLPTQEYLGGLYAATTKIDSKKRPIIFDNVQSAIAAYKSGQINVDQPIEILRHD